MDHLGIETTDHLKGISASHIKGQARVEMTRIHHRSLESQWERAGDLVVVWFQDEPCLNMEFRITSNLRMQAIGASFFGLPADCKRRR